MITNAWNEKAEAEEEMKLQWLSEHGHVRNDWVERKGLLKTIEEKIIGISLLEVMGPFMLENDHILMVQALINPSLINKSK